MSRRVGWERQAFVFCNVRVCNAVGSVHVIPLLCGTVLVSYSTMPLLWYCFISFSLCVTHSQHWCLLYVCKESVLRSSLEVSKKLLKWVTNLKCILISYGSCRYILMCNLVRTQHTKQWCCSEQDTSPVRGAACLRVTPCRHLVLSELSPCGICSSPAVHQILTPFFTICTSVIWILTPVLLHDQHFSDLNLSSSSASRSSFKQADS